MASVARLTERHYGGLEKTENDMIWAYRKMKDRVTELEGQVGKVRDLEHEVGVLREARDEWAKAKAEWEKEKLDLKHDVHGHNFHQISGFSVINFLMA